MCFYNGISPLFRRSAIPKLRYSHCPPPEPWLILVSEKRTQTHRSTLKLGLQHIESFKALPKIYFIQYHAPLYLGLLLTRNDVISTSSLGWEFRTDGEILVVFGENDPQEVKISKNTCLEGTSLAQAASFELWSVRIGWVVWAVDLRKKKKIHTYIHTYIHKLKMHICVIFHHCVGAPFQNRLRWILAYFLILCT